MAKKSGKKKATSTGKFSHLKGRRVVRAGKLTSWAVENPKEALAVAKAIKTVSFREQALMLLGVTK